MKIVHCGDIHLKIPENNEEFYINRFLQFTERVKEEDPDILIITGDLFDKTPTTLEAALIIAFIQDYNCPVLVVEGNHDRSNRKSKRANYLENLLVLLDFDNLHFSCSKPARYKDFLLVSNRLIRQKEELHIHKDLILLSHIRHELKFGSTVKKAEYEMSKLQRYKLCLLSDIHSTFQYAPNIFYSASPWRTHKQTITSLEQIDDSFFGFNIIDKNVVSHVELNLPNHYVLKTSEKVEEVKYPGVVDVEYEISIDDLEEFKGENIKVKHEESDIKVSENLYELIEVILKEEYSIKEPHTYMQLLVDIVGDLNET